MKLIDIHAHVQFPQFDGDREAVVARARAAGVGVINVGTDLETSRGAVVLADKYPDLMRATVGIHPTESLESDKLKKTFTELKKLASNSKTVAIGECGLDYARLDHEAEKIKKNQKEVFIEQIHLANEVKKPLMLHLRGVGVYRAAVDILKSESQVLGNAHFFAGNWEEAKLFLDLGFYLSFTGVITFSNDYDEVIKNTPLDRIMIETDCPFVAPVPYRGKRNEPSYLPAIAGRLATIRGFTVDDIVAATMANAARLFAFSPSFC